MARKVSIRGLSRAAVLAALVNGMQATGSGLRHPNAWTEMTPEDAAKLIKRRRDHGMSLEFDYVWGRHLKVNLGGRSFDPSRYDYGASRPTSKTASEIVRRLRNERSKSARRRGRWRWFG